jgi:hypothetical protein
MKQRKRPPEGRGQPRQRPARRRWPKAKFDPSTWPAIASELDVVMTRHAYKRAGERLSGMRGEAAARWVRAEAVRASHDKAIALHPPGWVNTGWASAGLGKDGAWIVAANGDQMVALLVHLQYEVDRPQLAVVTVITPDGDQPGAC